MKYCLNCRVSHEYLQKADEFFVEYRDIDYIDTLIREYPGKPIILDLAWDVSEETWKTIRNLYYLSNRKLILRIPNLQATLDKVKSLGIEFFFSFALNSFYDIKYVLDLGASYVYVEPPVFFDMENLKGLGAKIRAVPQVSSASTWGFSRVKNPCGSWIRPEDVAMYEDYIYCLEFNTHREMLPSQEEAYYRIYHDEGKWSGDLWDLIKDLGIHADNGLIDSKYIASRLNCKQRCQVNSSCHICKTALLLANKDLADEFLKAYDSKYLNNMEEMENGEGQ